MSTAIPEARSRGDWAQVMEEILQALGQSLQRCPEVPPSPAPSEAGFAPLATLEQHLNQLQALVEQAEWNAQETDRALAAAAEALRRWLGQEKKEDAPPVASS
jgi:hypothetical protein